MYHFHVNGEHDADGFDLPDIRVAKCEALEMAGRIICEEDSDAFWGAGGWTMKVTGSDGTPLFELVLFGFESPGAKAPSVQISALA
ncbi:DUF6894 family protein [Sphingomonas radiodurans]|uniref:DUF6894 family protein n=1 Tax=Sphingomonas radiodurans TaxID=2890321 RepID=UPI0038CDC75D